MIIGCAPRLLLSAVQDTVASRRIRVVRRALSPDIAGLPFMSAADDTEETVTLQSSDKQEFTVPAAAACLSATVQHLVKEIGSSAVVPIPAVHSRTLSKVLEYCKKHVAVTEVAPEANGNAGADAAADSSAADKSLEEWDKEFIAVDQAVLYEIILAANFMDITSLLDLCCKTVADIIKGRTPDEIRAYFKIENDFTPEEEEEVRRENQWAFE